MNTDPENMQHDGMTFLGKSVLYEYELELAYYANIVPSNKSSVMGALWQIDANSLNFLDQREGYPDFYTRKLLPVKFKNNTVKSIVYIMTQDTRDRLSDRSSSEHYLRMIIAGYQHAGIDVKQLNTAINKFNNRESRSY